MSCYRLIEAEKPHHAVSQLCRVLGVARAGYYAWASRPALGELRTQVVQAYEALLRRANAKRARDGAA